MTKLTPEVTAEQDLPPQSISRDDFTGEQLRAAYGVCAASVRTTKREEGAGNPPDSPADANPLAASAAAQDERAQFEAWANSEGYPTQRERYDENVYADPRTHAAWLSWKTATRECANGDCGWRGATARFCGAVGPLCPECGEVTE